MKRSDLRVPPSLDPQGEAPEYRGGNLKVSPPSRGRRKSFFSPVASSRKKERRRDLIRKSPQERENSSESF